MNFEKINEFFNCKFCKNVYLNPVILTCGHKICKKDLTSIQIKDETENHELSKVRCHICDAIQKIPEDGFIEDKDFNIFKSIPDFNGISFGEPFRETKASFEELKNKLNEMMSCIIEPDYFIHEYFSNIRNQIDIDKEKKKLQIDEHYSELINEINSIEKKQFPAKKVENIAKFDADIKTIEKYVKGIEEELNKTIIGNVMDKIQFQIDYRRSRLEETRTDYTNVLLSNISYKFESDPLNMKEFIDKTQIKSEKIKIEVPPKFGYYNFIQKDFKKFSNEIDSKYRTERFKFNNDQWYLVLKNKDGCDLTCYLYKAFLDASLISDPPETIKYELVINNIKDSDKYVSYTNTFQFKVASKGVGFIYPVTIKELLDDGFHNIENDSIHMTILLKIASENNERDEQENDQAEGGEADEQL